ncbi:MAG: MraZ N-terminal domain-containing protein, partial [Acidimicrobiia bacterium]
MFVGSYEHSLDDKGRIVLPAKFRERLATGGFVTIGSGGCLVVWTLEDYEAEAEDMKAAVKRGERSRD